VACSGKNPPFLSFLDLRKVFLRSLGSQILSEGMQLEADWRFANDRHEEPGRESFACLESQAKRSTLHGSDHCGKRNIRRVAVCPDYMPLQFSEQRELFVQRGHGLGIAKCIAAAFDATAHGGFKRRAKDDVMQRYSQRLKGM
jgi:hypothetical protein